MKFRSLTFIILAVALTVTGFTSCKPRQAEIQNLSRVEYYRSILFSETSFDLEKGAHPLTPEEARNINSYKFTYDSLGRLTAVEFVRNDVLLGYSSLRDASKITYEYTDGKQIKRFYDHNNRPIKVDGGVYTYEYALDANGLRTGLKFYDSLGTAVENRNKIHSYTWSKLPDGMVKENRYNLANEETIMSEFCPFYELRFTYNDKGFVTRMANYQGDTLYNCTAENCGDIGVSYFTFDNTDAGDVLSFQVKNTAGNLSNLYWGWAKRENKVDEHGYVLETRVYDQDDELVGGTMVPITQYVYDEHGAVIKTTSLDKDGNIMNNPGNGVAITEYRYDEQGQRIETLYYNKNNVAVTPKGFMM
jgi:YD repeat-containing protein